MFSKRLKQLRENKKMLQGELAKKLGVTRGAIGMWENGKRTPDVDMLGKIADLFEVTVDYLLGRTDDPDINIYKKDTVPSPFKELGIEYISLAKDAQDKKISPEQLQKLIDILKENKE